MIAALPSSPEPARAHPYLDTLTGLRGLAAGWVLLFHLWSVSGGPAVRWTWQGHTVLGLTDLLRLGELGVDLFFVLSGFVLTLHLLQPAPPRAWWPALWRFYERRALRLLPAYFVVLGCVSYLGLFGLGAVPRVPAMLAHLVFLNSWLGDPPIRAVFWTLPVEACFYLVLPLACLGLRGRHGLWWAALAVLAAIGFRFGLMQYAYPDHFNSLRFMYSFAGRMDQFFIGAIAALLYLRQGPTPAARWGDAALLAGLLGLLLALGFVARRGDLLARADPLYPLIPTVFAAILGLLILGAAQGRRLACALFANRPMRWLGTVSFSLYLWHTVVLDLYVLTGLARPVAASERLLHAMAVCLPPILALSAASQAWIEAPFLRQRPDEAAPGRWRPSRALWQLLAAGLGLLLLSAYLQGLQWGFRPEAAGALAEGLETLALAARQYGALALLLVGFWGLGQTLLARVLKARGADPWLDAVLAVVAGLGLFIVALQGLGLAGQLRRGPLNLLLVLALGLAAREAWALWRARAAAAPRPPRPPRSGLERAGSVLGLLILLLALLPTWPAPLTPPVEWDELMYHLPHAQEWAQSGHLGANEWLRFPWFPYNYNLLYAAALIWRGDVLAHLLHALAGWSVAALIYRLGLRHAGPATAALGAAIWLHLSRDFFANAYIDLGVALFISAAGAAYLNWREQGQGQGQDRGLGWLLLSAFMLGLAAGTKYQALPYLPLFALAWLAHERRPRAVALGALAFLLPCVFWYARNAWVTGDPVSPFGARLFGFHDWSPADLQRQIDDVRQAANWPAAALWPVLLAPVLRPWRHGRIWLGATAFATYALLAWYFTSHYDRYLVPAYGVLALLSAWVLIRGGEALAGRLLPAGLRPGVALLLALGGGAWLLPHSLGQTEAALQRVALSESAREQLLKNRVRAYELLQTLKQREGLSIYQWGLEDTIYYAPRPIRGEIFGPWRYDDLEPLSAPEVARRLRAQGFNTLLAGDATTAHLRSLPDFDRWFELMTEGRQGRAFHIRSTPTPG